MALVPPDVLYRRAKYVLRHEGARALVRQVFSFFASRLCACGRYYIYEKNLGSGNQGIDVQPEIDHTFKLISGLEEFDQLIAQGYDLRAMNFRPKLERGAIAFCLFVGQELASVTWVARSKDAKKEIDYLPFGVDFEAGEVCSGASFTHPVHRGKGLLALTYSRIFPYLADAGLTRTRFSIGVSNVASHKAHARFKPLIVSRGRYLRLIWWHFWREKPVRRTD